MTKYKAKKVTATTNEGETLIFDSKKERDFFLLIYKTKQYEGKTIKTIETQPKFLLQDKFKHKGKGHRKIEYVADFMLIMENGEKIVIDVKSWFTAKNPVYRIKKKLLLFKYPEIDFREEI